ncbi:hypothetical protein P8V03_07225 [Clostridium sp. A1-XYC3]|uniref:Uncharacterized protein n=1 Tax=Clostridium tanneri TaxID=3037988 RepID=A0ABU4JS45_9CLOT|nr:hypothetical protein [Clostridium sp. A1-XYC3]MDW8800943.1 hypothetical protein [Clostridium sp. A1-XYC3]
MDANKNIPTKGSDDKRLKNYSQVNSFNRLSDRDSETTSSLTAGGDKSVINEDINDSLYRD